MIDKIYNMSNEELLELIESKDDDAIQEITDTLLKIGMTSLRLANNIRKLADDEKQKGSR